MFNRTFLLSIILFLCLFSANIPANAADARDIDVILRKAKRANGAVSNGDERAISEYVSESLNEFVNSVESSEIISIRKEIAARSIDNKASQYSLAFCSAIKNSAETVKKRIENVSDDSLKKQMAVNFVILLAQIKSVELADIGMSMFNHPNPAVKYWAFGSVANTEIAQQLKSEVTGDEELAAKIISALSKNAGKDTMPEILDFMVDFADEMDTPETDQLLVQIADLRISDYADWSVEYELMDASLLNSLVNTIENPAGSNPGTQEVARRFAQLYSYVFQRFILGNDVLDERSEYYLTFVLADVEQNSISKLLRPQNNIKQLVASSTSVSLEKLSNEHDSLLGSESRTGRLGFELKFNYGTQDGKPRTAPKRLDAPKKNDLSAEAADSKAQR